MSGFSCIGNHEHSEYSHLWNRKSTSETGAWKEYWINIISVSHSLWMCVRPILHWQWNSGNRRLLWLVGHLREKRIRKVSWKCIILAGWCSNTDESCRSWPLKRHFWRNCIGKYGPENWLARWPDLTPLGFLSGYMLRIGCSRLLSISWLSSKEE